MRLVEHLLVTSLLKLMKTENSHHVGVQDTRFYSNRRETLIMAPVDVELDKILLLCTL